MSETVLQEIVRDLGRFESRLDALDSGHNQIMERLQSIDTKLTSAAIEDGRRQGMVKGGWWVVGLMASAIAILSSFATTALKAWIGHN